LKKCTVIHREMVSPNELIRQAIRIFGLCLS
jgi:hypothetical protein